MMVVTQQWQCRVAQRHLCLSFFKAQQPSEVSQSAMWLGSAGIAADSGFSREWARSHCNIRKEN